MSTKEDVHEIILTPIGHVERDAADEGLSIPELRARPVRIVIDPAWRPALLGVAPGSDLVVLYYLHRASRDVLQVHPRGDPDRPLRGVFATRSPARPNPIAVTTVRVRAVRGTVLEVVGLDALAGSPVLDLKSHAHSFDTPYEGGATS